MKSIKKKEADVIRKLHDQLTSNVGEYNELVTEFNKRLKAVVEEFQKEHDERIISLEAEVQDVTGKLEELSGEQVDAMERYMSERNDNWHDTDSGIAFQDWLENWQEFNSTVSILPNFVCFEGVEVSFEEVINLPSINK